MSLVDVPAMLGGDCHLNFAPREKVWRGAAVLVHFERSKLHHFDHYQTRTTPKGYEIRGFNFDLER